MNENSLKGFLKNKKILAISFMVILLILAFLFGKVKDYMVKNYIFMTGLFGLVLLAMILIFIKRKKISIMQLIQLFPIALVAALFWNLSVVSKYTLKTHPIFMIAGELLLNGFLLELVLILLDRQNIGSLRKWIKDRWNILLIYVLFAICTIPLLDSWLGLDGINYYQSLRYIRKWDFVNIFSLQMCGHVSQGYSIFALIGEYLFPDKVIGVRIINVLLAFVAIYAFYKVVEKLFKNASRLEKTLCTCLFAFSPMLIGMIHEINLDFAILCFFTCLVYAYIYNYEIWIIAFSVLLCFSKEPGVILYGMFIIGILTGRIIKQIKTNKKICFMELITKDIILAAVGGTLWIALYFGNSNRGWVENSSATGDAGTEFVSGTILNTFAVDWDYVLVRLKQMFLINFSWLVVALSLIGVVAIFVFRRKERKIQVPLEIITAISFSFIGFLIYNCFYVTWIHYRYLMVLLFFITFLYAVIYSCLKLDKYVKLIITCVLFTLIFVSGYITVDPMSVRNFNSFGTGKNSIIIPCVMAVNKDKIININRKELPGGDINNAALYNFEWGYFSKAFDNMLEELDYNSNKLILIHDEEYRINCYFGIYDKLTDVLYWNSKEKGLNINTYDVHDGQDYEMFNVRMVKDISALKSLDINGYDEVYLLDIDTTEDMEGLQDYVYYDRYEYAMWAWDIYKIK